MDSADSVRERFWAKVDRSQDDECWPWLGFLWKGYGRFFVTRKTGIQAHRFAYQDTNGPVPRELTIDHLCRNRSCCNPAHMETATIAENVLRGSGISARNWRKTHCVHGHPLSGRNLYVRPEGWRGCKACRAESDRRRRARLAVALEEGT